MTEIGRKKLIKLHGIITILYIVAFICSLVAFILLNNVWNSFFIVFLFFPIILAFFHRKAKVLLENGDDRGKTISYFLAVIIAIGFPIGTLIGIIIFTYLVRNNDELKKNNRLTLIINLIGWIFCFKVVPIFDELYKTLEVYNPLFYIQYIEFLFIINVLVSYIIFLDVIKNIHAYFHKIFLILSIIIFIVMLCIIYYPIIFFT